MIDLHAHILPGIDDGAADPAASLEMARQYVAAGFKTVVATPHARAGGFSKASAQAVRASVDRLDRALRANAIDLNVLPGMEVELDGRLPRHIADGAVIPLAGKNHLLVETPFLQMPLGWQNMLYDLESCGMTVIFAHPERCAQLMEKPHLLEEMAGRGVRLQVNWSSLAGFHGRHVQRLAGHMARQGLIHCVATDCHDPVSRHPGLAIDGIRFLSGLVDQDDFERIVHDNPQRVVDGLSMRIPELEDTVSQAPEPFAWWRRLVS
ncbi:MAG: tyrosine-protein phosphatase [Anaerolineae bacterium]